MIEIIRKEFFGFLHSLIAYVVIVVFLTGMGLLMWVFPETSVLEYGYADMEALFSVGPYVLMFLIPAVTMRSFSEEYKSGTIELLFTRPLSDSQIIWGKFLASFGLVLLSLLPTLVYFYSIYSLGDPIGNLDIPGTVGSYLGLLLLSGVFTSIGIFGSAISRNQIVAFVLSVFFCFLMYSGFRSIAGIDVWGSSSLLLDQLGILYHYDTLSKGLLDTRDLVYFASVILFFVLCTHLVIGSRKW